MSLNSSDEAYICSYVCTFCPDCTHGFNAIAAIAAQSFYVVRGENPGEASLQTLDIRCIDSPAVLLLTSDSCTKGQGMSLSKPLNLLPGALLALSLVMTIEANADQLIIDVVGIDHFGGTMMVAVFDSASAWKNGKNPISVGKDSVSGPSVRLLFPNLAPGTYAVKLYHDEDNNGKLDSNMLGIPSESYGFSNNPRGLGEPDFEEARFIVDGDTNIEIRLN